MFLVKCLKNINNNFHNKGCRSFHLGYQLAVIILDVIPLMPMGVNAPVSVHTGHGHFFPYWYGQNFQREFLEAASTLLRLNVKMIKHFYSECLELGHKKYKYVAWCFRLICPDHCYLNSEGLMMTREFNCQKSSRKVKQIANTYFLPSKNQARMAIVWDAATECLAPKFGLQGNQGHRYSMMLLYQGLV